VSTSNGEETVDAKLPAQPTKNTTPAEALAPQAASTQKPCAPTKSVSMDATVHTVPFRMTVNASPGNNAHAFTATPFFNHENDFDEIATNVFASEETSTVLKTNVTVFVLLTTDTFPLLMEKISIFMENVLTLSGSLFLKISV
jgi:hypothetical protein